MGKERENERIAALISFFLGKNPGSGRAQIVKFLYLTDLEYRRYQGRPITNLEYVWGDCGPFDPRILDVLENLKAEEVIIENEYPTSYGCKAYRYELNKITGQERLHLAEISIADHVARQIQETPLKHLLDDVVYATKPMLDAKQRNAHGEKLKMELVDLEKRQFGIDLEEAWEGAESLKRGEGVPADKLFNELLAECPDGKNTPFDQGRRVHSPSSEG